jgi:membrane peptidoglycan carboxypeptidase
MIGSLINTSEPMSAAEQTTLITRIERRRRRRFLRRALWCVLAWCIFYYVVPFFITLPAEWKDGPQAGDSAAKPPVLQFEQIPRHLVDATVAAEDQRFWSHGGIDFVGLVRALKDGASAGRFVSGASTITQQYVKISLRRYHRRTWKDKLRENLLARRIEMMWPKEKIIARYLSLVEYGSGTAGCAEAAQVYFKKELRDLTLTECSLLAGLPQAPSRFNPFHNFEGAKKRQEYILDRMLADGLITATESERARLKMKRLMR